LLPQFEDISASFVRKLSCYSKQIDGLFLMLGQVHKTEVTSDKFNGNPVTKPDLACKSCFCQIAACLQVDCMCLILECIKSSDSFPTNYCTFVSVLCNRQQKIL